ncbi:hypothetical protein DENSPDRAFT_323417 [Dentipellis sp. KUC8613]|nr:hypothetical protein DENSPDRAFT_323417 [Dentipellis sp. KUC8613]
MPTAEIAGFNKPLDEKLFSLSVEEKETFRALTGIEDEQELKAHILSVQAKAYAVHAYPCIRYFEFLRMTISHLPAYEALLDLGRTRADALFLDVGCCFGNDARKAILDGYPMHNVLASDLHPEFWDLGHELFKTSPKSFPVPFFPGDLFDPAFLAPSPGASPPSSPSSSSSDTLNSSTSTSTSTNTSTSLTPFLSRLTAIHASRLFHLFPAATQRALAHALGALLAPTPGALLLGAHVARATAGLVDDFAGGSTAWRMFCHSPDSWAALWDGDVFPRGAVRVEAVLVPLTFRPEGASGECMEMRWSVTRL